MLQLLIELLPQTAQFIRVAQIFGVDFLVERSRIGAIHGIAVGVGTLAPRPRTAGTVAAVRDDGLFLGLRSVIVGGFAFDFLGLRGEHRILFGRGRAFAVPGIILRSGLLSGIVAVLGIIIRFGLGLGFGQVHRGQQLPRGSGEGGLIVLHTDHFGKRFIG